MDWETFWANSTQTHPVTLFLIFTEIMARDKLYSQTVFAAQEVRHLITYIGSNFLFFID
jgi:hypothetical protein